MPRYIGAVVDPGEWEGAVGAGGGSFASTKRRGPKPGKALAELLRSLGGSSEPAKIPSLKEQQAKGLIDRPWPGTQDWRTSSGRRVQPESYRNPRTYELPESVLRNAMLREAEIQKVLRDFEAAQLKRLQRP